MKIELKVMDDDGNCEIEYDDEGKQLLIEKGFNAIIKDYLSQPVNQHKNTTVQFLQICGSWNDDRSESEIAESIRESRTDNDQRFKDLF